MVTTNIESYFWLVDRPQMEDDSLPPSVHSSSSDADLPDDVLSSCDEVSPDMLLPSDVDSSDRDDGVELPPAVDSDMD